jgi:2-C-methyl-D-erythritol 4-phosphate cytidylyltransferase
VQLAGRPLLDWSLDALAGARHVGEVVIAAPPDQVEALAGGEHSVVAGGETRSESVAAALETVDAEVVVVHDAARPLVSAALIDAVIDDLLDDEAARAVVAAAAVTDTIKEVARGMEVDRTLDRSSLWAAQTPQAFRAEALREAFRSTQVLAQATDDAMLIERLGGRVLLHEAPVENLKVTTPLDLRVAELLLAER